MVSGRHSDSALGTVPEPCRCPEPCRLRRHGSGHRTSDIGQRTTDIAKKWRERK